MNTLDTPTTPNNYKKSFRLLTSLFFMWGFITVNNDILINAFEGIFDLTPTRQSLIQFAFFIAFFVVSLIYFIISSVSSKDPINRIGYNNGMTLGLAICGLGCFSFYPAAIMNSYVAFLVALFILASGVTVLQICANPYATILGDKGNETSRLNLAQGFNSLGTTLGPFVGTLLIYRVFAGEQLTADSVALVYMIYGAVFALLAIIVRLSNMPSFTNEERIESGLGVLKNRHLSLGILAIFFYVGSEVSVGSWIVKFLKEPDIMGFSEEQASYFLSYFWGGLMIGRLMATFSLNDKYNNNTKTMAMAIVGAVMFTFIYLVTSIKMESGSFQMEFFSFSQIAFYLISVLISIIAFRLSLGNPARSLVIFCGINAILLLIATFSEGMTAFIAIISTGLFFSIGWSNVFSLAIKGLGKYTSQGSSLLVMAIVGGAIIPMIQSQIIENYNVQISFLLPAIGMIYLIYYGWNGHKISTTTTKNEN